MECSARLEFRFPSAQKAKDAVGALGKQGKEGRCSAEATSSGESVRVELRALDSVALRAHMNSIMRQIKVIEEADGV
jgi:tRNA threonylcarbamoyladenosine modification (KEOPS) complex  Pcc1 subunit